MSAAPPPGGGPPPIDTEHWRGLVLRTSGWYYKMELRPGLVTPGHIDVSTPELRREYGNWHGLPERLDGKSVLDVGSADGFFAFEAERRGARRVVSMDVGRPALMDYGPGGFRHEYAKESILGHQEYGNYTITPELAERAAELWVREDSHFLFYVSKTLLGSAVERYTLDVRLLTPEKIGETFDVVFFFGVVYHMRDPLGALERIASVTREYALVTSFLDADFGKGGHAPEATPYARYVPAAECNGDRTYWWLPNRACLEAWVLSSGFRRAEAVNENPRLVRGVV